MVKGAVLERVAKRAAHYERLVSEGKMSRQEATRRERESRTSIMGLSTPGVSSLSSDRNKHQAGLVARGSRRSGEVVLPSSAALCEFKFGGNILHISECLWEEKFWEPASHFNNVSVVSVVVRLCAPLDADDKSCRMVFAFSETKFPKDCTFSRVTALKGAVVMKGSKLEGTHTFVPPAGEPRVIRRNGDLVLVNGIVKPLWFVAFLERAPSFESVIDCCITMRYSCGGGAKVASSTSL